MKKERRSRQRTTPPRHWYKAMRIILAFLCIPFIAWTVEYGYESLWARSESPQNFSSMVLTNREPGEKYSYATLNALLRKYRRLSLLRTENQSLFVSDEHRYRQLVRLTIQLEGEYKKFNQYYYDTVDTYSKTAMPLKLQRRLNYYRDMIRRSIGQVRELRDLFEAPAHSPATRFRCDS